MGPKGIKKKKKTDHTEFKIKEGGHGGKKTATLLVFFFSIIMEEYNNNFYYFFLLIYSVLLTDCIDKDLEFGMRMKSGSQPLVKRGYWEVGTKRQ